MKKKLVSIVLVIILVSMSCIVFGQEQVIDSATDTSSVSVLNTNDEEVLELEGEDRKEFVLKLNSKTYTLNGIAYTLDVAPFSINGKTYVPLRFIVDQILGASLSWDLKKQEGVITTQEMTVGVKVGSSVIQLDGEPVSIEVPPIEKKGATYLPLKIVSDYLGYELNYEASSNSMTLRSQNKGSNNKPIADFTFSQQTYTQGKTVKATYLSYDPDGDLLIAKEWQVEKQGTIVKGQELEKILKSSDAGLYRIGLRVKDQYGLWSDWTYKELTILPNEPPKVTYLGAERKEYAQGEAIKFQYMYENESWEAIVNEKWTYRHEEEEVAKAILGKPEVLFTEGTYIVTLQIDDEYGNRSEIYETKVHITNQVLHKELAYRFTKGSIGDIIDNYQQFNYRDYEDAIISKRSTTPGIMMMSDSPEEVVREGILYRDVIDGTGRVLIHHINKFSDSSVVGGQKRLVVVAENTSSQPVTLTLNNKTIKGPVQDVLFLGQKLLYDYLKGSPKETIVLKPGEKRYIYDSGAGWKQDTCISGLMDVQTTGKVKFTVAAVSSGNTIHNMKDMEIFMPAVHPRGTFSDLAIHYTLDLDATQPTKLLIGTGEEEWVKGYDALTYQAAQNKGNYGVSYYITITAKEDMGILLNPRANVFRGAIEWQGIGVYNIPKIGTIFDNKTKAVCLGTINAGETKTFEYMLPNGSSAPVLIGFIPRSYWEN